MSEDRRIIEKYAALSPYQASTPIKEVLADPLIKDFARFLFPDDWYAPERYTLASVDHLLPFHSHLRLETTLAVIEKVRELRRQKAEVYYPLGKRVGLFYFPSSKANPFSVISAGGGFSYVGSIHESLPHALVLSELGYPAFALQYRSGGARMAVEDLALALATIFEDPARFGLENCHYTLWGGSAGARMAAYLGSYGTESFGQKACPRADAVIMEYTGHTDYSAHDPATFAVVGKQDGIASWRTMARRLERLRALQIPTEFHAYEGLGHGFGLGIGTSAEGWIMDAVRFIENNIYII